ncbi:MAG TPA: acetyl-CoA carboxylase, carboxyltransferase subunit beta [Acidimicrobiales bacterium]|nr:acetyl-CoA carboxylase, carboxyltransferase subunit beta [Acidimicrobiales bacterium]
MEAEPWAVCSDCRTIVYRKRLARSLSVCPSCGRHERLTAGERLTTLLDPGSMRLLDVTDASGDPLGFVDTVAYPERIERARQATGLVDAVECAVGAIQGHHLVVAAMDFRFLGGSLGCATGEAITRAADVAHREQLPLLLVSASGGARMQEGALSLMQMAKTAQALSLLDEAGLLTISLVTDPTYGGVAASFATLCDVILAEPRARLGFAGPRVVEQTIRQALPPGFQTAEFLLAHGQVDGVVPRSELRPTLARILALAPGRTSPVRERADPDVPAPVTDPDALEQPDAWTLVTHARDLRRPTTLDYVSRVLDGFQELRGDRLGDDCPAIVGGVGLLAGRPLVVIGHQKGHTPADLSARNFGMPSPAGYRKAARLLRLAAKLRVPVLTLIDTPGAHPGVEAEARGQAQAVASSIRLLSTLPVPVVGVVTGEGGSGGALALGVTDRLLMFSGAYYSVISPEGCAAILWNDAGAAATAAQALKLTAPDLLRLRVVDGVLPEPEGGTQTDHAAAAAGLRSAVVAALEQLDGVPARELLDRRRARFRAFGAPATHAVPVSA